MTPAAALRAGWSIIPTGPDKKPLIAAWKPYQTRRPTDAEFMDWSRLNPPTWAMVTGAISGRIALDFDGDAGRHLLEGLGLKPHRRTPSGGFHADFRYPGWHVKTLNSKTDRKLQTRYPGLDIRGDGGYACIAGRTDDGEYEWLRDPEPYELDTLPADLREFLGLLHPPAAAPEQRTDGKPHTPPMNGRVDAERLIRMALDRAGLDGRNNSGMWLACQLRDNGFSHSEAEGAMRNYSGRVADVNTKGEHEAYSEEESIATLREAYSRPAREPWQSKAVPESGRAEAGASAVTGAPEWQSRLLHNKETNKLLACYENVALFLEHSSEWQTVIGYNEFTGGYHIMRQAPAPVTTRPGDEIEDHFDTEVTRWLERHGVFVRAAVVRSVVDTTARRNSFHPVKDYLESLPNWDGVPRVESWLIDYCGVASSDGDPNYYAMAVGACWLRSAVARIMQPGCKADHMLVLEGEQGIGKSTAARILAGDWFTDQLSNMDTKDASMQLRGAWIIELSELGTLGRADSAKEKAFLSQQEERFRLPYGKRLVHIPRQCVFIGTTNADSWLKDETGGRRFWPVRCRGRIDLDGLLRDRDQLWAETLDSYRAGARWYLESDAVVKDAIDQQKARYETDVWQPVIEAWLREPTQRYDEQGHPVGTFTSTSNSVTIDDVLAHAVGKRLDQWTQGDKNRIARCLTSLGWERYRHGPRGAREWRYRKAVAQ